MGRKPGTKIAAWWLCLCEQARERVRGREANLMIEFPSLVSQNLIHFFYQKEVKDEKE